MQANRHRGFTLIEVLAALAVIAIAMTAVIANYSQGINTTILLRERTIALWVAQNRLITHQMNNDWPNADTTEGTAEMADKEWQWREQVVTTPDENIRRVEIEIRSAAGREAVAHLVGFLAKPQ
jgi:general secretion pathway protein I